MCKNICICPNSHSCSILNLRTLVCLIIIECLKTKHLYVTNALYTFRFSNMQYYINNYETSVASLCV